MTPTGFVYVVFDFQGPKMYRKGTEKGAAGRGVGSRRGANCRDCKAGLAGMLGLCD